MIVIVLISTCLIYAETWANTCGYTLQHSAIQSQVSCPLITLVLEDIIEERCLDLACTLGANAVSFHGGVRGCSMFSCSNGFSVTTDSTSTPVNVYSLPGDFPGFSARM